MFYNEYQIQQDQLKEAATDNINFMSSEDLHALMINADHPIFNLLKPSINFIEDNVPSQLEKFILEMRDIYKKELIDLRIEELENENN